MGKNEIELKGNMVFVEMANFLDDICKSFREKTVCIQKGSEFVTLNPTDTISFEVGAERKKGKQKLTVELSWAEEITMGTSTGFKVSSKEPELPACTDNSAAVTEPGPEVAEEHAKKSKDKKHQNVT